MLPVPGPGTDSEDSVTSKSDSDLQQSLSRRWALLPAVSSLTVTPQLTCQRTDRHSFQVEPEIPGPLTSSCPAHPPESEPVAAGVQRQSNIKFSLVSADLKQQAGPGVSDFNFESSLQAGTSYRYSIQPRHTFDNVVSKSFCHWLKSDSM
jgi:hypothetical protein